MDFTTSLTRLLSDRVLRDVYIRDPEEAARILLIDKCALAPFLELDPSGLENQAQLLLNKRFFEVRRMIPATCTVMGAAARSSFLAYAETYWPEGYGRHVQDAVAFCRYLLRRKSVEVNRPELNRLRFVLEARRIRIHLVLSLTIHGRPKRAIQILYRSRHAYPRQLVLYLGL